MILVPPLIIEPDTRTDFTLVIAPSAAVTIASGDLEATPLVDGELLPHAVVAPATNSPETSKVAIRRRTPSQRSRIRLACRPPERQSNCGTTRVDVAPNVRVA